MSTLSRSDDNGAPALSESWQSLMIFWSVRSINLDPQLSVHTTDQVLVTYTAAAVSYTRTGASRPLAGSNDESNAQQYSVSTKIGAFVLHNHRGRDIVLAPWKDSNSGNTSRAAQHATQYDGLAGRHVWPMRQESIWDEQKNAAGTGSTILIVAIALQTDAENGAAPKVQTRWNLAYEAQRQSTVRMLRRIRLLLRVPRMSTMPAWL